MKMDLEKMVLEILAEIPDNVIPKAYVRSIVEENADCFDTRQEILAETKMQLTEESGVEFMLTRGEFEDYLCEEVSDERWESLSSEGRISSRLVRAMEEDEDSTIFEMLKNMPLIPAAKLITGMVMKQLDECGVDAGTVDPDAICTSVIEDLNTYLSDLTGEYDDDFEDDDDDDDGDVFGELGLEFDLKDNELPEAGDIVLDDLKRGRARRSRITRFPGSKT